MSKLSRRTVARLVAEQLEPRRLLSDVIPVGPEFRVNTYTSSFQLEPVVAMDADGDFVTAWQSSFQDGDNGGIYAQRYDAAGDPLGPEFRVNTVTAFDQTRPAIAMDANGSFVVAWDNSSLQGDSEVHAQRFNSAGVPQGGEFRVNTYTTDNQGAAAVAMDADGDFVIAWHSLDQGEDGFAVYAQRFNAAGVPQGVEFRANTFNLFDQAFQTAAMDADGDFVIA